MFSITISEKGGAERREAFEKQEINIGRVQGNDLMLPKGNVSKHHARLLFRDGRFIVTDLKSTNGTYVNGRKIAQATIVREGDKIYIGDFVLRIESAAVVPAPAPAPPVQEQVQTPAAFAPSPYDGDELETAARERNSAARAGGVPSARPGPPPIPPSVAPMPSPMPGPVVTSPRTGQGPISVPGRGPSAPPPMAAPPPIAAPLPMPAPQPMPPMRESEPLRAAPPQVTAAMGAMRSPEREPVHQPAMPSPSPGPAPQQPAPLASTRQATPSRTPPRESPQAAARRLALLTLVDRVADAIDLAPLRLHPVVDEGVSQRLERTVRDQASAMRTEGEVPEGIDVEQLIREATRELVSFGPIGPLLDEDDVTEISALRHDHVFFVKNGTTSPADVSFTSEEALGRAIARLAHQAGEPIRPGESTVERRLPRGHMVAMMPPAASGHALLVRKRRRVETSLEELVRLGAVSRAMATFLENCIAARANILVCGPHRGAVGSVLAALSMATGAGERVVAVQDLDECAIPHAYVLSVGLGDLGARGEAAVRAAARLSPDRLVVSPLAGAVAAATLDVVAEGAEGVLAACVAPSLRQAVARIVAQTASARAGGVEAVREALGETFDVAVEVVTLSDGRTRVVRVAELAGSDAKGVVARDVFTSTEDGSFVATGVVPRAVADFGARGVKVDPNLFKRAVGR